MFPPTIAERTRIPRASLPPRRRGRPCFSFRFPQFSCEPLSPLPPSSFVRDRVPRRGYSIEPNKPFPGSPLWIRPLNLRRVRRQKLGALGEGSRICPIHCQRAPIQGGARCSTRLAENSWRRSPIFCDTRKKKQSIPLIHHCQRLNQLLLIKPFLVVLETPLSICCFSACDVTF